MTQGAQCPLFYGDSMEQFSDAALAGFQMGVYLFGPVWGVRVILELIRHGGSKE